MSKIEWTWNLGAARSTMKWREVQSKTSNLSHRNLMNCGIKRNEAA